MEKSILKNWDDPVYHAVDSRCRYWLLTRPKTGYRSNDGPEKDAKFIEGEIEIHEEKVFWKPIGYTDKLIYPKFEFKYDDFVKLMHDIGAILRVLPNDVLKIYAKRRIIKEYIYGTSVYLEHEIPSCYHKIVGGYAVYTSCKDKFIWEEILNDAEFEEKSKN